MTLHVNIEHVQYCCSVLSDVRFGNAGQGHYAMGRVVGQNPLTGEAFLHVNVPPGKQAPFKRCHLWQTLLPGAHFV